MTAPRSLGAEAVCREALLMSLCLSHAPSAGYGDLFPRPGATAENWTAWEVPGVGGFASSRSGQRSVRRCYRNLVFSGYGFG